MNNEEFQKLVLEKLTGLEQGQIRLDNRMETMDNRMEAMDNRVASIEKCMATKDDIARLETKIDTLASEGQKDVIAILTLLDSKIEHIQEDIKSIAEITGEHEMRIRTLMRRPV